MGSVGGSAPAKKRTFMRLLLMAKVSRAFIASHSAARVFR